MARQFVAERMFMTTIDTDAEGRDANPFDGTVGEGEAGSETLIGYEFVPRGAHLTMQSFDFILRAGEKQRATDFWYADLRCWSIPDHTTPSVIRTEAQMKTLYNQWTAKVDATPTTKPWTATDADEELGEATEDTNLIWRPDRISLKTLTEPGIANLLFKRRFMMGYSYGNGYRIGSVANNIAEIQDEMRFRGMITTGVHPVATPAYVMWILTIPPAIDDDAFSWTASGDAGVLLGDSSQATGNPNKYDFLSPKPSIVGEPTIPASIVDDWRQWSVYWKMDDDTKLLYAPPATAHTILRNQPRFTQRMVTHQVVSPTNG